MKLRFRKPRDLPIIVLLLLAASFVVAGIGLAPVHATNPTVANAATGAWASGTTFTVVLTVAAIGDSIAVFGGERCQTANCVNGVIAVASPGVSGGFTFIDGIHSPCVGSPVDGQCGGVTGQNWDADETLWVGTASATGAITITLTLASASLNQAGGVGYDIQFATTSPTFAHGVCGASAHASCPSPIAAVVSSTAGQVSVAGVIGWTAIVDATGGCTFASAISSKAGAFINGAGSCGFDFTGFTGFETGDAIIGAVFPAPGAVTVTTVLNTACLGACSGGNNGTSIYLPDANPTTKFNLHFYASQNLAAAAQIDNVTLKVAAVHITTATGTLYVCEWGATGPPNGGNLYLLIQPCTVVTIINGTSNFFVHVNPQANLLPSQFYAVGILAATTASRGSGASLSGISIYETSQTGITEFKYSVGSAVPPNSFFSNTVLTPREFIFIHSVLAIATITTTSTTTVSGVVSSTVTITSTSTLVVNQGDPTKAGFWYIPMFYLLLFAAVFIGSYGVVNAVGSRR